MKINMTNSALKILTPAIATLALGLLPNGAKAATLYFDPNAASPVTAGTYTWDTTTLEWATSSTLSGSPIAWVQGDNAVFTAGSYTGSLTVDVNSTIDLAGFFDGNLTPPGSTLTLADPFNTGSLVMAAGAQAVGAGGSDGNTVTMEVPMTDAGGVNASTPESEEDGVNALYLYAPNTTTGGFILGPSSNGSLGGVVVNNNTPFGTGTISSSSSTATREISTTGTSALTIGNAVSLWNGILELNAGATAPLTLSGALATSASGNTSTLQIQNGAVTLTGGITGAGNFAKTGTGSLTISGANSTYTGSTTISAGTLFLRDANEISTTSGLNLAGGRLDPLGDNQVLGSLTLSGSSTTSYLDFEDGDFVDLQFNDSHALTWGAGDLLDIVNYNGDSQSSVPSVFNGSGDEISFGDQTGLTASQLADIEFNSDPSTIGEAALDADGDLYQLLTPVLEPSTIALAGFGGLSLLLLKRRKA